MVLKESARSKAEPKDEDYEQEILPAPGRPWDVTNKWACVIFRPNDRFSMVWMTPVQVVGMTHHPAAHSPWAHGLLAHDPRTDESASGM